MAKKSTISTGRSRSWPKVSAHSSRARDQAQLSWTSIGARDGPEGSRGLDPLLSQPISWSNRLELDEATRYRHGPPKGIRHVNRTNATVLCRRRPGVRREDAGDDDRC